MGEGRVTGGGALTQQHYSQDDHYKAFCTPPVKKIKMLGCCPSAKDKNQRKIQEFKSLEGVDQSINAFTQLYS